MALSVINRPSKEIEGYESTWNAINLPIQYKLNSDLFPVNNVDTAFNITGASNDNSFLSVTISGASTNTLEGETIKIEGSDIESYNGIFRIKEKISDTEYTINVAYKGVPISGTFQKYYNNYFAEVRLYAGLPDSHAKNAEKPIEVIGTLRVIPDTDNNIIASFSGLIKDDVNLKRKVTEGIDINHFTGYYVEFREGYDENVNGEINTVYTAYEKDQISGCGNEIFTNNSFTTDLTGWNQALGSNLFTWSAGSATANLNTNPNTAIIFQEVNLIANVQYKLDYDISRTNNKFSAFSAYGLDEDNNVILLAQTPGNNNDSGSVNYRPPTNIVKLGFSFNRDTTANTQVSINEISLIAQTCEYQFWGSNSSLQFQNERGGNMYDYIAKGLDSKFMTKFDNPTYFEGEQFDLSVILSGSNSLNEDLIKNSATLWVSASDLDLNNGDNISLWEDKSINGNDLQQLSINNQPSFVSSSPIFNNLPCVQFSQSGGFDFFKTTLTLTQPYNVYIVHSLDETTNRNYFIDTDSNDRLFYQYSNQSLALIYSSGVGRNFLSSPSVDTSYIASINVNGENSKSRLNENIIDDGVNLGSNNPTNIQFGLGMAESQGLNGKIAEIIITEGDDPCLDYTIRKYLGDKYDAYDLNSYYASIIEYKDNEIINTTTKDVDYQDDGVYRLGVGDLKDDTTRVDFKVSSVGNCDLTETKSIKVNKECINQQIYLTWLNTLDGWDYWNFTSEKDYNLSIEDKVTIERNIFNNWDNTFINGDTQLDVISSTAYKEIDVYSQYLNLDELQAISEIKYSTKVLLIDGDKQTTVIVDSDSITLYNDGDEQTLYTIRFKIRLPNIQTQSQ